MSWGFLWELLYGQEDQGEGSPESSEGSEE